MIELAVMMMTVVAGSAGVIVSTDSEEVHLVDDFPIGRRWG